MLKKILIIHPSSAYRAGLSQEISNRFQNIVINAVSDYQKIDPFIVDTNVIMTYGSFMTDRMVNEAVNLEWIQSLGSGVDGIVDRPSLPGNIIVTNTRGVHGAPVAEAAIGFMLAFNRDFPRLIRNQENRCWDPWPSTLLDGQTVGIFGLGTIGEALARRCKAFGMTTIGIGSRTHVLGFDTIYPRLELPAAVKNLDHLVLLAPLSKETRNAIDGTVLNAMKPTAYVINVARGEIVQQDALIKALTDRTIAGAAIDVFDIEPLPPDHPLWLLPNVMISPHSAGMNKEALRRALPVILHNVRAYLSSGETNFLNVVDKSGKQVSFAEC